MTNNNERKELLEQVEETLTMYCTDCFLYRYHRKEFGRNKAHQFCLSSCTVGEKLRTFGISLNQKNSK
ncbi:MULTISPECIES: zinc-finger domain-containing protein [Bacillus]|uniref:zinc-finger domain-containing protein n=1 Tax=Bacillus TaxID=1386 RepID=UPI0003142D4A|nr:MULTISPECIES: zinc-finger domain-containing protein [Bacillus]